MEKNILGVLRDHGVSFTIYLHTYDLKVLTNPRSQEKNIPLDPDEYRLLHPDVVRVTSQEAFLRSIRLHDYLRHGDAWGEPHHSSLKNFLCQLHSLDTVFGMSTHASYDGYLCLRPDLEYVDRLDMDQIREIVRCKDRPVLYTPAWDSFGGCNDRFCFGTRSAIERTATRLQELPLYAHDHPAHAERFLQYIIEKHGIESRKTRLRAIRVRANGTRHRNDAMILI